MDRKEYERICSELADPAVELVKLPAVEVIDFLKYRLDDSYFVIEALISRIETIECALHAKNILHLEKNPSDH